jgi:superfamily II DNA or RNA helicase/diadenosine tetraphosphate (Ap4A) HIT family hydrolase/HKD family nuclease
MVSPFLPMPADRVVACNDLAFAIRDGFPVSPGHTLVITKRLVPTWFEATREEQLAILELVDEVKAQLDAELRPDGYNVGFNAGVAAGQTVMHLHVHVIPRRLGDVADPRGGVRHLMPGKGNYLAAGFEAAGPRASALATGGHADPFVQHLRPLFRTATDIAILAAFANHRGVEELEPLILSAARGGARIRLITGDYLNITQRAALAAMLGWMARDSDDRGLAPQVRVVESAKLGTPSGSFHPKSWRFEGPDGGVAFVGSSNLSHAALHDGVEWNLRVERERDRDGYARVVQAFDAVWQQARVLDAAFLHGYRDRPQLPRQVQAVEMDLEPIEGPGVPHGIQAQALSQLAEARREGRQRALVVMATGLGKTWLAAFDVLQLAAELGRTPRVLFLAHRSELLRQAAKTLGRAFPLADIGFFVGGEGDLDAQFVFASVQKLSQRAQCARLADLSFDYAVVDEVHHATAASYLRILGQLRAGFVLGLTATPERTDQADVEGLFDDHVAYRADIAVGIAARLLAPFHYFGLKDTADYADIPWRNGKFDLDALARAVETQARMAKTWEAWQEHPGARSLVFCCSIAHANFVAGWLRTKGVRLAVVHSGPDSDDRESALLDLAAGTLDAVCAVDLFNEGIDVPLIDRVVMLRPSESPVVFLQQLGRGLRSAPGKEALTVIDFVGNHRVFLWRLRTLLETAPANEGASTVAQWLTSAARRTETELPAGCSVDIELEAIDLLASLLPRADKNAAILAFRQFVAEHERRPTAGELYRLGLNPRVKNVASWFEFASGEGQLDEAEQAVLASIGPFLADLDTTPMTKCYKMVTLQALIEADALRDGLPLDALSQRARGILMRSPELARDIAGVAELGDTGEPDPAVWQAYWRKNPVRAWLGDSADKRKKPWFRLDGERFVPLFAVPEALQETAAAMVAELVDWRLAEYRRRAPSGNASAFDCDLMRNDRHAILKLPGKRSPWANTVIQARVPGGEVWTFRIAAEYCNVAYPADSTGAKNRLGELLVRLFGEQAGQPGTNFRLRFEQDAGGWRAVAVGQADAHVLPFAPRVRVRALPSLRVAAGWATESHTDDALEEFEEVELPGPIPAGCVAVRASGSSMAGWRSEIRDGDWLIVRPLSGVGFAAVEGQIAVVARGDAEGRTYHCKRVVRGDGGGWWLRSDNPEVEAVEVVEGDVVVGVVVRVVHGAVDGHSDAL